MSKVSQTLWKHLASVQMDTGSLNELTVSTGYDIGTLGTSVERGET